MKKNVSEKTAKRLTRRINVLEERYDQLVHAVTELLDHQDIKIAEIEEYLEIGE